MKQPNSIKPVFTDCSYNTTTTLCYSTRHDPTAAHYEARRRARVLDRATWHGEEVGNRLRCVDFVLYCTLCLYSHRWNNYIGRSIMLFFTSASPWHASSTHLGLRVDHLQHPASESQPHSLFTLRPPLTLSTGFAITTLRSTNFKASSIAIIGALITNTAPHSFQSSGTIANKPCKNGV